MKRHWIACLLIAFALLQQSGVVVAAIIHTSHAPVATEMGEGCHADTTNDTAMPVDMSHSSHMSAGAETADCCTFDCECCVGGCSSTLPTRSVFGSVIPHRALPDRYTRNAPLAPSFSFLKPPIFV